MTKKIHPLRTMLGMVLDIIPVLILGGIASLILGGLIGEIAQEGWPLISTLLLLTFAMIVLAPFAKIDNVNWFAAGLSYILMVAVSGAITTLVPAASSFVLTPGAATPTAAVFTLFYVMLAQTVLSQIRKKL